MAIKKGFTLIELMVVVVVIGILLTVGINLFFQVVMTANKATTEAELRQNASFVMETISREVRKSQTLATDGSTLTLCSGTSCPDTAFETIAVSGLAVQQTIFPAAAVTLSSPKVWFFNLPSPNQTFTTTDGKTVTVALHANSPGSRWDSQGQITETETITVRNGIY